MIHPIITEIFPNGEKVILFFRHMSDQIKQKEKLEEFFKWHLDVISEVINEIDRTAKINFAEKNESENWAKGFLKNYDGKIRKMRKNSNQVFERFHELKIEFGQIMPNGNQNETESDEIMQIFLNKQELLIGKIIFAYRELWFVANQINDSNFKIGSIHDYQEWVKTNYSNLKNVKVTLQEIQHRITK